MLIQKNSIPQKQPNFQANLIAKVLTKESGKEIRLYKLDYKDKDFAREMAYRINLEALYPNESDYAGFKAWKGLINGAVDQVGEDEVILATHNRRPCGIISFYKEGNKTSVLSRLVTWPIKTETKVEHSGKALVRSFFENTITQKISKLKVEPISHAPRGRSCKTFYSQLGFAPPENSTSTHLWRLNGSELPRRCAQIENAFEYTTVEDDKPINLYKELTLKFRDTFMEKVKAKFQGLTK